MPRPNHDPPHEQEAICVTTEEKVLSRGLSEDLLTSVIDFTAALEALEKLRILKGSHPEKPTPEEMAQKTGYSTISEQAIKGTQTTRA